MSDIDAPTDIEETAIAGDPPPDDRAPFDHALSAAKEKSEVEDEDDDDDQSDDDDSDDDDWTTMMTTTRKRMTKRTVSLTRARSPMSCRPTMPSICGSSRRWSLPAPRRSTRRSWPIACPTTPTWRCSWLISASSMPIAA